MAGILIALLVAIFFIAIESTTFLGALKKAAHFLFYWNIVTTGLAMIMFSILSFGDVSIGQHTLMHGRVLGHTGSKAIMLYAVLSILGISGAYLLDKSIWINGADGHYTFDAACCSAGIFHLLISVIFLHS